MESDRIDGLTVIASAAAILAVEFLLRELGGRPPLPGIALLGLARLIQAGLLLAVVTRRTGGVEAVGLGRDRTADGIRWGLVWSAGFAVAAFAGLGGLYLFADVDPRIVGPRIMPGFGLNLLLYFLVGGLVSPVAEEIFFRGILYGYFRRWGVIAAVIASTVIFVLSHRLAAGVIPVTQTVGGIAFAIAYEKHKSLITPIIIHILGNLAIFTLGVLR